MALQKMSEIVTLKKDMIVLEKGEFSAHKAENEKKLKLEWHQLDQQAIKVIKAQRDKKKKKTSIKEIAPFKKNCIHWMKWNYVKWGQKC